MTDPAAGDRPPNRPALVIAVVGTATDVGKTWAAVQLLNHARRVHGLSVAARKPVQSYDTDDRLPTDAAQLALATGQQPHDVCPAPRWYPLPMAPPIAADILGRNRIALADLRRECVWANGVDLAVVELAGGVCSPVAHDGDSAALARLFAPDIVVLVADASLGAINAVRCSVPPLQQNNIVILLNRYDSTSELHRRNRDWIEHVDGYEVATDIKDWFSHFLGQKTYLFVNDSGPETLSGSPGSRVRDDYE